MEIYYLKAFHIIFVVTWMAATFFMGRMLIYFKQSEKKDSVQREAIQEVVLNGAKRVWYIISLPSMILTLLVGGRLMVVTHAYSQGWFHLKFLFVFILIGYCHYLNRIRKNQANNKCTLSEIKLRVINEVPTLFLVSIVFTVFFKNLFSGLWAIGVVIAIITLSLIIMKLKKK